ncbi:hypothetical protein NIA73_14080 [Anaerobutyricum hallii]|nr:hypothetical protein [Anaerobutyricum hallii]MCO7154300.1 hypothetical protein [Anaerobutyricum hallii]
MPTCTKPGLTATYCLNPDCIYGYRKYYKTEKIAPLGHSYIDKTYKATCTAPKTIVTSCKNCKYKSTHKEGKALGHRWSKWKLNTDSMIKRNRKRHVYAADAERKRRFMLNSWKEKLHAI